jgi:type II secretory pathway pseudopilin PulG
MRRIKKAKFSALHFMKKKCGFTLLESTNPKRSCSAGFTIIEVTLFLAISGLLLLIVIFGIGSNQHNAQFHDSMQSINDFLNQQVNALQSGVNLQSPDSTTNCSSSSNLMVVSSGTNTPGSNGNCIILGRMYYFGTDKITSNDVVGARDTTTAPATCNSVLSQTGSGALSALLPLCPTIQGVDSGTTINTGPTFSYSWGSKLQNGFGRNSAAGTFDGSQDYQKVTAIGIFRNPGNNSLFPVAFNGNSVVASNINTQFCFKGSASYYGAVYLGGSFQNGSNVQEGSNNLFNVKVDDPSCGVNGLSGNFAQ